MSVVWLGCNCRYTSTGLSATASHTPECNPKVSVYVGVVIGVMIDCSRVLQWHCFTLTLLTDRGRWNSSDSYFFFEAMYAVGSILAVCRLSYIFAIHPRIGPLMKSLSSMVKVL